MKFLCRAKTETRRQAGPSYQPQSQVPLHTTSRPHSVVSIPNNAVQIISSTTPSPPPYPTQQSTIDPGVAAALLQQHQINSDPSYNPINDENVLNPQLANAILSGHQIAPNRHPGFISLRQRQGTPNTNQQPFFGWFGNNNNNNQLNQQDSTTQTGPILSWLGQFPNAVSNLVQNNPISNFISNWQNNNQNQNSPFQNFVSNAQTGITQINPFPNLFQGNNNNNNNNPSSVLTSLSQGFQQVLPSSLQSDYITPTGTQTLYPQSQQTHYMPTTPFSVQNNIDNAMFMNNKYPMQYNPNNPIDLNSNYYGQQMHNNYNPYPMQSLNQLDMNSNYYPQMGNQYTAMNSHIITNPTAGMFPYQFQYPMTQRPYKNGNYVNTRIQTTKNGLNRKTTRRKQSNRNKIKAANSSTTESAWFEDFLDKRRQMNTNVQQSKDTKDDKSKKS